MECVITGKRNIQTLRAWHGNVSCGLGSYVREYHMAVTQAGHRSSLYNILDCPAPSNRHSTELAHTDCERFQSNSWNIFYWKYFLPEEKKRIQTLLYPYSQFKIVFFFTGLQFTLQLQQLHCFNSRNMHTCLECSPLYIVSHWLLLIKCFKMLLQPYKGGTCITAIKQK